MTYTVLIDPKAKQDLLELFQYVLLNDGYNQADELVTAIESVIYKLEEYPKRGHIPEELRGTGVKKYLEVHYKPYRIIYDITGTEVYVHCVLDGRRNIQEILSERVLR